MMLRVRGPFVKRQLIVSLALAAALAPAAFAGSTGTTALHTPQGSGAGTAFGDYVSDAAALNTSYHYFVEATPALGRLRVQIFDADLGIGDAANEDLAGRDRLRGGGTTVAYSIFNPRGQQRTAQFTTGSATLPALSDNAWLTLFDSTGDYVQDNFTTAAYTNNDGLVNWGGNWIETNDDNNATAGNIQINGAQLRLRDDGNVNNSRIERQVDLSLFTTATLTFNFSTANLEAADQWRVEVSANGGGSWTTLETFTGALAASTRSYDISAFKAANTRIRFLTVGGSFSGTDSALLDNVKIADSIVEAGHWEVRIDQSSAVTAADDINAFGIRADDGDATSAGTELNVYVDSMFSIGANPPAAGTNTRNYTLYPWVTAGCSCTQNDYDLDTNSGTTGSMTYTSRSGAFTQTLASATLSTNDVWNRDNVTGFTSDQLSTEYGIWTLGATVSSYLVAGNPNGNYAAMYVASNLTAANPPTANPFTNAMRTYLPNDAGAAPVKPYLEQLLTRRFNNTLPVGSSGRYTVSIRITNPTSQSIVFSATNVVTTNVPGAGAVYNGSPQVSQGSVLTQPAVGGTGNITWNPGTLAAGGTALLSYDVLVTPNSAGQRIVVTGAAASVNGTRARWVDETGNTTQTRATYTFGPICELATTQGLATEVLLSKVDVSVRGGATLVSWTTASEAGTIGFNVYRLDRATNTQARVNASLLPANPGAAQGGNYKFVDSRNADAQPVYYLEELTAQGKTLRYGPFTPGAVANAEPLPAKEFERAARTSERKTIAKVSGKKVKPSAVMAGVRKTGITRVTASDIASTLGVTQASIASAIKTGRISLTSRGAQVAWTPAADNASLLFFGEAADSIYSNERVYRLEVDKGTTMSVVSVATATPRATSFTSSLDAETDAFPATVLPLDADGDYWFWDFILSGDSTYGRKAFNVDVPSVAGSDAAVLQVRLQGAIEGASHIANVTVNGVPAGSMTWSGLDGKTADLTVPAAVLHSGANNVEVAGVLAPGAPWDVFYIDGFTLRYTRSGEAAGGALEMNMTPGAAVSASALGSDALAFDITSRTRPALLSGASTTNGTLSLIAPSTARTLYFADATAIAAPSSIRAADAATLNDAKNGADYLVIAPAAVRTAADSLAQLRTRDGLRTYVADLEQIYDEYSGGNITPIAIRDFIASTRRWSPAPKYVVLAGIGTLDYRGITVDAGLVPPLMASTSNGLFAADSRFVDFDNDGVPNIAIGRIPVTSNAELDAYVRKLDASSRASIASSSLLFSADARDNGADFRRESGIVEQPLADIPATRTYADDLGSATRSAFLAAWQQGTPLVSWLGHGGVDRISNASLLTTSDAASLTSTGRLPVFVAMTCTINRFELGDVESLGAALTRASDAGATSVWSSSGLSTYATATDIERTFLQLAARTAGARIGDLIVGALNANKTDRETASLYLLLGDPAIRLSLPPLQTREGGVQHGRE
jgi:hypothetical protein